MKINNAVAVIIMLSWNIMFTLLHFFLKIKSLLLQARFKELWKNFNTYTSGEQLLGLPVTKYDFLQKKKYVVTLHQQTIRINSGYIDMWYVM